jgi:predicted component of type VI protein secretion system
LAQAVLEPGEVPVPLEDHLVSRRHAIIRADGGQFTVTDAGSTDGTHLNETEITGPTAIADGDRLRFGDTVLVASLDRSAPPATILAAPEVDADRTVFQAPLVSPRPPESPAPTRPPDSPAPVGSAPPQTQPRVGPVAVTPAPIGPPTPTRTPRPVTPVSEPAASPVLPSQPAAPPPLPPLPPVAAGREAPAARINLSDVTCATSDLSASLRQLEREVSAIVDKFERAGGRPALLAFVAQARRVEANPASAEDIENLIRWLPTACRMLETELQLLNLLSPQASHAPW